MALPSRTRHQHTCHTLGTTSDYGCEDSGKKKISVISDSEGVKGAPRLWVEAEQIRICWCVCVCMEPDAPMDNTVPRTRDSETRR